MKKKSFLKNMAAVLFVVAAMTACARIQDDKTSHEGVFTQVIHLTLGEAQTRAVDADGHKSWSDGEKVGIYYRTIHDTKTYVQGTVEHANGKSADIRVTFSGGQPKGYGDMRLIYPAGAFDATAADGIKSTLLDTQDGTLATLSSTKDVSSATVQATADGRLPDNIVLTNVFSIFKFTVMNGSTDLSASVTALTITDGTHTYSVRRTVGAGPIYVMMRPVADVTFNFTAIAADGIYAMSKSGVTLDAGRIYTSTLNVTESNVGKVLCTDGSVYASAFDAENAGKTVSGMIAYEGTETGVDGKTNGLVLSLTRQGSVTYDDALSYTNNLATARPAKAGAWAIPTVTQMMRIMQAFGGDGVVDMPAVQTFNFEWGVLNDKLTACSGAGFNLNTFIWTCTESNYTAGKRVAYYCGRTQRYFAHSDPTSLSVVRPVFAW